MRSFILITALLLCSLSWITVSVSESQTVEVQPGEEITLQCSNISRTPTHTFWSRFVNRTEISCISSMFGSDGNAEYCDGFQNGKFKMSSNVSTVSLKIMQLDLSDSGLYFCGFYMHGRTILKVIDLNVQEESDGITKLMSVILGGVTAFIIMVVIGLVVKIKKLQKEFSDSYLQNLDFDDLNDTALSLYSATIRSRRHASEREVETQVIYAASR
ncbi:uncharacterized protein LOC122973790 [Thunnus albacares]|uniref:uncharacterized protein LOC122973790 n=1 Tax=Thunnus albacares TaxID=8236 RepID=UPI001CF69CFB|nr:uncharacterized protein LOC122973790 [Thunnus albacares]